MSTWTDYLNLSGKSGVLRFFKQEDSISVEFEKGRYRFYRYDASQLGSFHINEMGALADRGFGLNSYINLNRDVRDGYADRW